MAFPEKLYFSEILEPGQKIPAPRESDELSEPEAELHAAAAAGRIAIARIARAGRAIIGAVVRIVAIGTAIVGSSVESTPCAAASIPVAAAAAEASAPTASAASAVMVVMMDVLTAAAFVIIGFALFAFGLKMRREGEH